MAKKKMAWIIVTLVVAAAVFITAYFVNARKKDDALNTDPEIVTSYEPSDPVKLDLGGLDDITSITVTLGNGTEVQVEGEECDIIIEFLENLTVVKLRDSKGIYGWDYLVVLYSGEERRQIVSFIYNSETTQQVHRKWVMYGDYVYYLEDVEWEEMKNLLSVYI